MNGIPGLIPEFNFLPEIIKRELIKMTEEVYVSVDIEADGPIPGPHNMISLVCAAFNKKGHMLSTFSVNLKEMPGTSMDPGTQKFWDRFPEAYAATKEGAVDPRYGMKAFESWLKVLPGRPVFVAYPAGFDFTFVLWYLTKFLGYSPFSHAALDMKTYAACLLNKDFRKTTKRALPKKWFLKKLPHTHIALDDAIEQGYLFMGMLKARQELDETDSK